MEHWLERIIEPDRLVLAWQAPDGRGADRFRWAVAYVIRDGADARLTYLAPGPLFSELNAGRSFDDLRNAGYSGYPAFSAKSLEHRDGVIQALRQRWQITASARRQSCRLKQRLRACSTPRSEAIIVEQALSRRLPPRSRSDFGNYSRHFRIPPDAKISNFGLLGLSEARLPNDGFSLVDPLNGKVDQCDLMLEVAGFRYYSAEIGRAIELGEPVQIVPEPASDHDPNAIMIRIDHTKIGNINRLQTAAFSMWLSDQSVEAWVERLNGKPSHPRLFIFVRIRPRMMVAA